MKTKLILAVIILFFSLFGIVKSSHAATYYASPNGSGSTCSSISPCSMINGIVKLAAGDILILNDGIYSSALLGIPNGDPSNYVIIKSANDGGAIITGGLSLSHTNQYIQIEGLKFDYNRDKIILGNHIKILRTAFRGGGPEGNVSNVSIGTNDSNDTAYILLEDCWAYGAGGRYTLQTFNADHIIFRRVVVRHDGGWSDTKGDPEASIGIYNSSHVETQNCIVIDSENVYSSSPPHDLAGIYYIHNSSSGGYGPDGAGKGPPHDTTHLGFRGNIVLSISTPAFFSDGDGTVSTDAFTDNIAVGLTGNSGYCFDVGNLSLEATVTKTTCINAARGAMNYGSGLPTINHSIMANLSKGYYNWTASDNYNFNVADNSTPCSNCTTNINPIGNGLTWLPKIETGSVLANDGVGATVMKKYGVSGTLWGENGYNTLTSSSLWPWPNEDRIKADFASVSGGARGFATGTSKNGSSQTLTKYIWEYLGKQIPDEIYGGSGDTTPPAKPSGLTVQ